MRIFHSTRCHLFNQVGCWKSRRGLNLIQYLQILRVIDVLIDWMPVFAQKKSVGIPFWTVKMDLKKLFWNFQIKCWRNKKWGASFILIKYSVIELSNHHRVLPFKQLLTCRTTLFWGCGDESANCLVIQIRDWIINGWLLVPKVSAHAPLRSGKILTQYHNFCSLF